MFDIYEKIVDPNVLHKYYIVRNGFVFTSISEPTDVFDAIVIRYPSEADCVSPKVGFSSHNLEEHLKIIADYGIKKALIIADNIDFLPTLQTLESLEVIPAKTAKNNFDYTPLYEMPGIRMLKCETVYGRSEELTTTVDYSNFKNLQKLHIQGEGHLNYQCLDNLQVLTMCAQSDINMLKFDLPRLKSLTLLQCGLRTLDGLEHFINLQELNLWYLRKLVDISLVASISSSLRSLSIENVSKIDSFECLSDLVNLEYLRLSGNNKLNTLSFLQNMKKLQFFYNEMPVLDGDVKWCLDIPYAAVKCKKYYNLSDKKLPKNPVQKFTLL